MNLKLKKKVKSRNNNGIVQKIRENCGGVFSPILKDILFNFSLENAMLEKNDAHACVEWLSKFIK